MKRNALLFFIIGIILIVCGIIWLLLSGMLRDDNNKNKIMNEINSNSVELEKLNNSFNEERKILYDGIFNVLSVNNIYENYDGWYLKLTDYRKNINNISKYKNFLIENCIDSEYDDSNLKSECVTMSTIYETINNYYVKDINKFNDIIDLYNEDSEEVLKLSRINLGDINYIDFNDDGNYIGMKNEERSR